jgi:hypothetical protein
MSRACVRFLGELERLFANIGAALLAHNPRRERDVFQAGLSFHFFVFGCRAVYRFRQRKEFDAALHALGIFTEYDLIDGHIWPLGFVVLLPRNSADCPDNFTGRIGGN